jgi:hypothetical protein
VAQIEGVRDLILTAGSGLDGSGQLGARGGGAVMPATKSRGGAARGSPDFTVNSAPGSNHAGLGSVVNNVTRMIHLGHFQASGVLRVACVAVEAGLRGGARWHTVFRLQEQANVYDI